MEGAAAAFNLTNFTNGTAFRAAAAATGSDAGKQAGRSPYPSPDPDPNPNPNPNPNHNPNHNPNPNQVLRAGDWRQPVLLMKAARNVVLEWTVGVQERIAAAFLPNARHTDAPLLRALADFVGEEADAVRMHL